jgi:lysophospholipase L1-like esterase
MSTPIVDFESGSVTQTGWTNESTIYSIASDQSATGTYSAKHTTADSFAYGYYTTSSDSNSGNCRVTASLRATYSGGTGFRLGCFLRGSGATTNGGSHYMAYLNVSAGLQLWRRNAGVLTQLGSTVGSSSTFASNIWYRCVFQVTSADVLTIQVQRLSDLQWLNSSGTWVDDSTAATVAVSYDDNASGSKITGTGKHGALVVLVAGTTGGSTWVDDVHVDYFTTTESARIDADDADVFFSPWAWRPSGSGATAKKTTATTGNYLKTVFTGDTASLLVDTSGYGGLATIHTKNPVIKYSIDGAPFVSRHVYSSDMATGIPLKGITGTGSHTLELFFAASTSTDDDWTTPENALIVSGLRLGTSYDVSTPTLRPNRTLFYGDSITRGAAAAQTSSSIPATDTRSITDGRLAYTAATAQAMDSEYGVVAFSGQGWTVASAGNAPDFESTWDEYSNGQSRLSTGLLTPEPDHIFIVQGTNDSAATDADVTNAVYNTGSNTGTLKSIRAAAGAAKMFLVVPFGQFKATAIEDGFDDYQADDSDSDTFLIDLGTAASLGLTDASRTGASVYSYDTLHPDQSTHGRLGAMLAAEAIQAMAVFPTQADVDSGVIYGPTGSEYTGSLVGGGGGGLVAPIISGNGGLIIR